MYKQEVLPIEMVECDDTYSFNNHFQYDKKESMDAHIDAN